MDGEFTKYLKPAEAARYLKCSVRTLARYRALGIGPSYCRVGGQIIYSVDAIDEWIAINTVRPVMAGLAAS